MEENQTIIAMVREGLGITIMPELALPHNLQGSIVKPLLPEPFREISIITRSKKQTLPAVKAFIKQRWIVLKNYSYNMNFVSIAIVRHYCQRT